MATTTISMNARITVDPDDDGEFERHTGLRQVGRVDVEVKAVFASDQKLRLGADHVYLQQKFEPKIQFGTESQVELILFPFGLDQRCPTDHITSVATNVKFERKSIFKLQL